MPPADPDVYAALIRDLDMLEGYAPGDSDNLYERQVIRVDVLQDGKFADAKRMAGYSDSDEPPVIQHSVEAYIYVCLQHAVAREAEPVPGGNWRLWLRARGLLSRLSTRPATKKLHPEEFARPGRFCSAR